MYNLPPLTPEEILIYLRKSRADDPSMTVQDVLEKHEQLLDDWCTRNLRRPDGTPYDRPIPECNRLREVASGETVAARPMMQKLLSLVESPVYKAVLIVEPQRLSRGDLEDIGRISKILRYTGTLVLTLQYTYDPTDTRDRDDLERELKRGNEYLEYTKRILNRGRTLAAENGQYLGSVPPYGYRRVTKRLPDSRRPVHTLEPIEEEAEAVRTIFRLYADGRGAVTIARTLDSMGTPAPGSDRWSQATVDVILRNPVYIGKIRWNRRKGVRKIEQGDVVKSRPVQKEGDYLLTDGLHPPIITMDDWNAVQSRKGSLPRVPRTGTLRNPLAGLLYCHCGNVMTYRTYSHSNNPRTCAPRFLCTDQPTCHTPSVTGDDLLREIAQALRDAIADFRVKLSDDTSADDRSDLRSTVLAKVSNEIQQLKAQELNLWREKTAGRIPEEIFDQLLKENNEKMEQATNELARARTLTDTRAHLEERLTTFEEALASITSESAPDKQNRLLKACIQKITYTRGPSSRYNSTPFSIDVTFLL